MIYKKPEDFEGNFFTAKDLYKISQEYAKHNHLNSAYTETLCSRILKRYFKDFYQTKNKLRQYVFPENLSSQIDEYIINGINNI